MVTAQHRIVLINEFSTRGLNQSKRKIDDVSRSHDKLDRSQKKTTKGRKSFLGQFTKVRWAIVNIALITALGVALGKLVFSSANMRLEIQKLAKVTTSSFGDVKSAILSVRGSTLATNEELITSFQELAKAGFDLAQQQAIIEASAGASLIGFASLQETALATAQVMKQFGFETEQASDIAFKMAAIANAGKVDINTLGQALKFSGAIANQTGTSFEELAASVAILSNKGLQMTQIGRGQRQVMLSLLSPSSEADAVMNTFRIELENANETTKTFTELMAEFEDKLSGLSEPDKKNIIGKIFPSNAITVVLESMGETNDEVIALTENIEKLGTGARIDAIELQAEKAVTLAAAWEKAKFSVKGYVDTVVENILVKRFEGGDSFVEQLKEEVQALGKETGQIDKINQVLEKIQKRRFPVAGQDPGANILGFSEQDVALLLKLKATLTDSIDPFKQFLGHSIDLNETTEETGDIIEKTATILEVYSNLFDIAIDRLAEFNKEVETINELYGEGVKAQQLINQSFDDFVTKIDTLDGRNVSKIFQELVNVQDRGVDVMAEYRDQVAALQQDLKSINISLSTTKDNIKDVNTSIDNILSRRFSIRGLTETKISQLISQQQRELEKAKFATLGLGTAEDFLRNASIITTKSIDDQTESVKRLIDATIDGKDKFEAWKTTLQEAIKSLIINSQDLDKDVTAVVRRQQTELLSITRFDRKGGDQFEAMETNLNALQQAQGIFFGEERDKLMFSEQLREDRINGMNESADKAIENLMNERTALEDLIRTETDWLSKQDEKKKKIEDLRTEMLKLNAETREHERLLSQIPQPPPSTSNVTVADLQALAAGGPLFPIETTQDIATKIDTQINQDIKIIISGARSPMETAIETKREIATLAGK